MSVTRHQIDVDDEALEAARAELGTASLKDTVNEALRAVAGTREQRIRRDLETLASIDWSERDRAWR